jgi:hypothetical protein
MSTLREELGSHSAFLALQQEEMAAVCWDAEKVVAYALR